MGVVRTIPDRERRERARRLRREDTDAEARLWEMLRDRRLGGWKFKRQVPVGPYIVDFVCLEAGLVIELDGGQHAERVAYDTRRTVYLQSRGLRVIRFWNSAVVPDADGVGVTILEALGGDRPGWDAIAEAISCRSL